jgi:cephalosporin hydroxylase
MSRNKDQIAAMAADPALQAQAHDFILNSAAYQYSYHFTWLGRPVIQYPQDLLAVQEIIWRVKPDLIIETGIAHGGSLVFSASMLELLGGEGRVVGIDIDIRAHNLREIEAHPLFHRITMIEGSSTDDAVAAQAREMAAGKRSVLLILDSHHTHDHVLRELELYSPLVTAGSYAIVMDTIIEELPEDFFPDRPWGPGNNPRTAVGEFLRTTDRFEIDREMEAKLLITLAPGGYLRCVKE